jgi:hypothetical protein
MKTKTANTRTIDNAEFCNVRYTGYVRKVGSQFSGKWAEYTLCVTSDNGVQQIASIRKLHKYWINDQDQMTSDNIDSQTRHLLEKFARRESGRPINMAAEKLDIVKPIPACQRPITQK